MRIAAHTNGRNKLPQEIAELVLGYYDSAIRNLLSAEGLTVPEMEACTARCEVSLFVSGRLIGTPSDFSVELTSDGEVSLAAKIHAFKDPHPPQAMTIRAIKDSQQPPTMEMDWIPKPADDAQRPTDAEVKERLQRLLKPDQEWK